MKYRFNPGVILRRGCPRCGHPIFRRPLEMYEECPGCGLDFDRGQPGYFTGAMYVSYALAIPLIALLTLIEHLMIPSWSLFRLVLLACGDLHPADPLGLAVLAGHLDSLRPVDRPRAATATRARISQPS